MAEPCYAKQLGVLQAIWPSEFLRGLGIILSGTQSTDNHSPFPATLLDLRKNPRARSSEDKEASLPFTKDLEVLGYKVPQESQVDQCSFKPLPLSWQQLRSHLHRWSMLVSVGRKLLAVLATATSSPWLYRYTQSPNSQPLSQLSFAFCLKLGIYRLPDIQRLPTILGWQASPSFKCQ